MICSSGVCQAGEATSALQAAAALSALRNERTVSSLADLSGLSALCLAAAASPACAVCRMLQAFREEGAKQPLYRVRFQQTDVWELYQGKLLVSWTMQGVPSSNIPTFLLAPSACYAVLCHSNSC